MSHTAVLERGGNHIDERTLAALEEKLIQAFETQGRSATFAEWATFAHFILNTDVAVGRALAAHLAEIIELLQPAMPEAKTADVVFALSTLAQFMNLGLTKGAKSAESEMTAAWEAFISKIAYPAGNVHEGFDVDAALQRWRSAAVVGSIQNRIFGQVIEDYQPKTTILVQPPK